jgi:nucleoside-diphosphate-sugar epimerase
VTRRVLVTGATGFVGRALVAALLRQGWQVRATGRDEARIPGGCEFFKLDFGADPDLARLVDGVEAVVHLAARVHVMGAGARELEEFRRANTVPTRRLADAAARGGARHLVFMSSIKVNGESTGQRPFMESDVPSPGDPYAVSKLEAEMHLREVAAGSDLRVTMLRPPLVYGPGALGNFARLLAWIRAGRPLPLAGVTNRRSLLFVGNLCSAIAAALDRPPADARTFLVSDGEDLSTPELVRRIARAAGIQARLFNCPPVVLRLAAMAAGRAAELERLTGSLAVDTSRIRSELDWAAPHSVDEGLSLTLGRIAPS